MPKRRDRAPRIPALLVAVLWFAGVAFSRPAAAQPPPTMPSTATPAPTPAPPPPPAADPRDEARVHFEKGLGLVRQNATDAALAEFLVSRQLYATKAATTNAAMCLRQLHRYDEALDMAEALLREFSNLSPAEKAEAQRLVVDLSSLVGTLTIEGAVPGAAIVVDGKNRGEYPLLAPLRVGAGSHVVRVYKEGFTPAESRVEVAGGQTAHVKAPLKQLALFGRVEVSELSGRALDIVIDGNVVGRSPWAGPLAPGDHTVLLRGDGLVGTQPVSIAVRPNQTQAVRLTARELDAALTITPTPAGARIAIDGVTVGRGTWDGRLQSGEHVIEVAAPGFVPSARTVTLAQGRRETAAIALQRDSRSEFWRKPTPPSHFIAELQGGLALVPGFGGDAASGCGGGCKEGLGAGGYGLLRAGYALGIGVEFGVAVGTLYAKRTTTGRSTSVTPVGAGSDGITPNAGTADDTVAIRRSLLLAAYGGTTFGERFPVRLRLGAGLLFSELADARSGRFTASDGTPYEIVPLTQSRGVTFFHVDPEIRVGFKANAHLEIDAAFQPFLMFPLSHPRWDATQFVGAGHDGLGHFASEPLVGQALLIIAPGFGVRYAF